MNKEDAIVHIASHYAGLILADACERAGIENYLTFRFTQDGKLWDVSFRRVDSEHYPEDFQHPKQQDPEVYRLNNLARDLLESNAALRKQLDSLKPVEE